MTKFSVVVPLYNKAAYVERTLLSIASQSYTDYEVIVVDDGSTDGGAAVVRSMCMPRVRVVSQKNAGVSVARNRGIAEAQGTLLAFLDADDSWRPGFLAVVHRLHAKYPNAGAYATAYELREPGSRAVRPTFRAMPRPPWEGLIHDYFDCALGMPPVTASSVAVPASVFREVGGFPVGEKHGEDLDMWLRIALRYPIAFSQSVEATYYRDRPGRACAKYHVDGQYCLTRSAIDAVRKGLVPRPIVKSLREYVAKKQLDVAGRAILEGRIPAARAALALCDTRRFLFRKMWWAFWASCPRSITHAVWRAKARLLGGRGENKHGKP